MSASLNIQTGVAISLAHKEVHKNMIDYTPNKTLFARFFSPQSDKKTDKSHNVDERKAFGA